MRRQECRRRIVQHQGVVSITGERICGESSRRKYKCPPVLPPPCDSDDSQFSRCYYTPAASTRHCDERPTSKKHPRQRKKISVTLRDRSQKRSDCSPILSKIHKARSTDKRPLARAISCTDSASSDDLQIDQRTALFFKPERCMPTTPRPVPKICCERPVNMPQREKQEFRKECCNGGNLHISVRPKSPQARELRNCQSARERKTTDCTVQTEFIRQSHKACQVSSRAKIATIDITAQTVMPSRAVKDCQTNKSRWDVEKKRFMRDQCLQTPQDDENKDDDDFDESPTQGHAFPFVGESPSGYLKIAKHMVAFENKNIGILVADPTKTRLWHKELQNCDDKPKHKSRQRKNECYPQHLHKEPKQWYYRHPDVKKTPEKNPRPRRPDSNSKSLNYHTPKQKENRENYLEKAQHQIWEMLGFDEAKENEILDVLTEQRAKLKLDKLFAKQDDGSQINPPSPPTSQQLNDSDHFRPVKESELSLHEIPSSMEPSTSNVPSLQGSGEYLQAEQKENEINAAVTIQRHVKGYLARKRYKKIRHSAKVIQDALRGHWARQQLKENLDNTSEKKKSEPNPISQPEPAPTPESHQVLVVGPFLREDLKVPRDGLLVLGGSDPTQPISVKPSTNTGKEIFMYSINSMTWTNVGALPEPRTHFGIAKIGYEVYIIGGCDPRYKTPNERNLGVKTVWKVHLKTLEWYFDSGHPRHLDNPRSHFGCAGKEGAIYIFGGNDAEARALSTCQKFDTLFNTWTPIKAMDGPRVSMGVTVYENHIWLAGGISKNPEKPVLKSVIYYDTVTDSWTTAKHNLPLPRAFPTLVVAHDKLFMVGGAGPRNKKTHKQTSVPEVLVMSKATEQWREAGVLNIARHGHAAVAIDHQIIVLGGVSSEHMGAIDSVEVFDLSTSHSQKVRSLYGNLSGMGAVSLQ